MDFGRKSCPKRTRPGGGVRCDGLRLRGVWRNSGGRFSAWHPLEVRKQWHSVSRPQNDFVCKTLDRKGDACHVAQVS